MPSALKYKEVIDPTPRKGELLIAVKACSVNFPDTLIIQGLYQIQPKLPFSPGSDIAGVVEDTTHFKVGDEIVGFNPYGGFAEKVVVKQKTAFQNQRNVYGQCFSLFNHFKKFEKRRVSHNIFEVVGFST